MRSAERLARAAIFEGGDATLRCYDLIFIPRRLQCDFSYGIEVLDM